MWPTNLAHIINTECGIPRFQDEQRSCGYQVQPMIQRQSTVVQWKLWRPKAIAQWHCVSASRGAPAWETMFARHIMAHPGCQCCQWLWSQGACSYVGQHGATWGNRIYDETALEFLAIPSHGFLCTHIVAARGQTLWQRNGIPSNSLEYSWYLPMNFYILEACWALYVVTFVYICDALQSLQGGRIANGVGGDAESSFTISALSLFRLPYHRRPLIKLQSVSIKSLCRSQSFSLAIRWVEHLCRCSHHVCGNWAMKNYPVDWS